MTLTGEHDQDVEPTVCILRRWRDKGYCDFIALFPEIPGDNTGLLCDSFEHVGQHGAADYHRVLGMTEPATKTDCLELIEELKARGYRLRVMQRDARWMVRRRLAAAAGFERAQSEYGPRGWVRPYDRNETIRP